MYVKKIIGFEYLFVEDLKNLVNFLLQLRSSLRDLCVRWSFGRCLLKGAKVFYMVFLEPIGVGCRIADLVYGLIHDVSIIC